MKITHMIGFLLLTIGGLNWGLIGLGGFFSANWNVVHMILGGIPALEWTVYILVGLSAAWLATTHRGGCSVCKMGTTSTPMSM